MLLSSLVLIGALATGSAPATDRFERIAPAEAGFSAEALTRLAAYLEEAGSSSMVLTHDGKIFFEWGDLHRKHVIHSMRKALLNSLYGVYVGRGAVDTGATLAQLGIDDIEPRLTKTEKSATLLDVLKSRSGVYHPSAAESPGMLASKPERGAHAPGEAFYYNNWDFNVAGAIFEKAAGKSIYEAFAEEIARPLGMTQYTGSYTSIDAADPDAEIPDSDGVYQYEKDKSRYPAYHFRMSTHDLALYGNLYLNRGTWNGKRIIPEEWIDASTTAYSVMNPEVGIGYGMLWYVLMESETRPSKSFFHSGVGVHLLGVYPGLDMVLVHRVDTEGEYDFPQERLYRIIDLVFGALQGRPQSTAP